METTFTPRRSKKKRKTHTTRAYRKCEQEVESLLRETKYEDGSGQELELEARSLRFFHGADDVTVEEQETSVHGSTQDDEEEAEGDDEPATELNDSPGQTYIEIELQEPPLVWPGLHKQVHYYDDSFLYTPANAVHFQLHLGDCHPRPAQIRMLNRFQEQAKGDASKLNSDLVAELCEDSASQFVMDNRLYRTISDREFPGIFLPPAAIGQFEGIPTRRCLTLTFKRLRFSAHPLLLPEHRLAQQLDDLFNQYTENRSRQICQKLKEELELSRQVASKLLTAARPELSAEIRHQLRLTQKLRQRYYAEATDERKLSLRLLREWARLKALRSEQNFQCTRFQLKLHVCHLESSHSEWNQQFEDDLAEVYREQLELFYCRRRHWGEAMVEGQSLSKPPRKPSFDKLMASLKKDYERAFRHPEEPYVDIVRLYADEATTKLFLPASEQLAKRRNRSYFLRLYLDDLYVGQTRSYRLEEDLHLYMNESFGVLLERKLPQNINIWLYEKSTLTQQGRRLAVLRSKLDLSRKEKAVPLKLSFQAFPSSPQMAGDVCLYYDYSPMEVRQGVNDLDDIQALPNALLRTLLPPRLPAAAAVAADTEPATPIGPCHRRKKNKAPVLVFTEQQLQFCPISTLLSNKRFQLLRSRHQQRNLHTKQLRFVPALEQELSDEGEAISNTGDSSQLLEPGTFWNPIDLHKHRGYKFLKLLYEVIGNQSARRAKAQQSAHPLLFLAEGFDLSLGTSWTSLWRAFCSLFQGGSNAMIREPAAWQPQAEHDQFQHYVVSLHVVRATGVPVRSRHLINLEELPKSGPDSLFVTQTLMYSNVRPFVSLSYGQRLSRSRTAEGSNPTWNEELQLQLSGHHKDMREDLKISLFDELIEQQASDEASDVYQRVQCNWLGEYRVPISSLLASGKFEGCIELVMPKVLIGYRRPLIDSVTNLPSDQYPEFKESVHLWFYLSIEPNRCDLPPLPTNALACAETGQLQAYLNERRMELQQLLPQPQRFVEPLVCTALGKRVCVTRLLEQVPLPGAVATSKSALETACRFVALLCQLRSYDPCLGFRGVWLDNQTLLDSTWCSVKDQGVLLCNFMLGLGLECWLVLGQACPHGECTFVIYRQPETAELLFVAPASGRHYQLQDVHCPLRRVYCLVNKQNMYFNIQSETRVSMTHFNLQDAACWFPLFNRQQSAPQGCVQVLDYAYKRSYELSQLQKNIERKIMKKISGWRTTRKTNWNRAFQPQLQKILGEMEAQATYSRGRYEEIPYNEQLERDHPNYKLYGFTLNFSYTNLAAVSDRIRSTCIHYNNNPLVEFCVAVQLKAYANDVISVWVFLLSAVPLA
ncbi:coiled-coil and C2 domain-containing protein 2A [Drosophila guanche]|uniref:Blast:Coiled-coil and C2 domain-containing protein 2A n=1 Tax=Drosophila guanche TaxID=7266 RepID=A0A3B0JNW4_DROGU|nr:coiled-coil and C2 domain-containing protein 2A [Drosophila guanche]SPP75269.1 blast:Coiled-coil and C2 domain-containing protein 2A [Drosophila guanche]